MEDELFERQQYSTTNRKYEQYAIEHTQPDDELMLELVRRTNLSFTTAGMLSGVLQGRFLKMICSMMNAQTVLEIGTYTGYSAIYMARGMAQGGVLHSVDNNPEISDIAEEFVKRAGLSDKVVLYQGNALEVIPNKILPALDSEIDLVFIDADKENYIKYYKMCIDKVRPGGLIIADNVLWYGRVLNETEYRDKETKGIVAFNKFVNEDKRVERLLLPVRDGLMIAQKLPGNHI